MRTPFILAGLALAAFCLIGCSDGPTVASERDCPVGDVTCNLALAQANGWSDTVSILEDGEVTREEWTRNIDHYVSCLEDLGYVVGKRHEDPIAGYNLMWENVDYRGPGDGPDEAQYDHCEQRYFFGVNVVYTSTHEQVMAPELMAAVHLCLDEKGIDFRGDETKFQDFYATGESFNVSDPVATCVLDKAYELYPDLPGAGLGF